MRTFYESFVFCIRNSQKIKPFLQITILSITLVLISGSLITQTYGEDIDWQMIKEINLNAPIIDTATAQDGSHIFILTAKAVLIYARAVDKIVNRIPVDKAFDNILFVKARNEFILISKASKSLNIIKIYPIFPINIEGRPFLGPANAPVTIVVFHDYQCSACALLEEELHDVMQIYPEKVKLVIKQFPNSAHDFSEKAAIAANAAGAQGKFWEFHRALIEQQASLNDQTIQSIATKLVLDMTKFNKDLQSIEMKDMVDRDISDARKLRIKRTPMVFINGKYVERNSSQDIINMIETGLNKAISVK